MFTLPRNGSSNISSAPATASTLRGAVIGDSIAEYAIQGGIGWSNRGFLSWVRRYCGSRVDIPQSRVFATAGMTIQGVIDTWLTPCIAARPDFVIVHVGTNSIGAETTANLQAQYQTLYDALTNAGIIAIIHPIMPKYTSGGVTAWSGDDLLQVCALNSFTATYCETNPRAIFSNINPLLTDFTTGNALAADLMDGLHPSSIGARKIGANDATIINRFMADIDNQLSMVGDTYHATKNPSGNLLTNGLLVGSQSATMLNGATGNGPTDWYGGPEIAPSTASLVFSKTSYVGRSGLEKVTMTFSGTGDSQNQRLFQSISSGWSVGDTVSGEIEVNWNITAGVIGNMGLRVHTQTSGFVNTGEVNDGFYDGVNVLPTGTDAVLLRTGDFVIPANSAGLYFSMQVTPVSGSINAVVSWARARLQRKIS